MTDSTNLGLSWPSVEERYIFECAASHRENGDFDGSEAITYSILNGWRGAILSFPEHRLAIENAWDYARQEADQ